VAVVYLFVYFYLYILYLYICLSFCFHLFEDKTCSLIVNFCKDKDIVASSTLLFASKTKQQLTDFALFQSVSVGEDESRVGAELTDEHGERAAGDVRLVELDVDVVDAVLARHEAHRVFVLVQLLVEDVLLGARRRLDETLERAQSAVQIHVERGRLVHLRSRDKCNSQVPAYYAPVRTTKPGGLVV